MHKENGSVCCIAVSRLQANRAVTHLINAGFSNEAVSVLYRWTADPPDAGQRVSDAAANGHPPALNWEPGGALNWLVDVGIFRLPGAGNFVVAGPLLATLGGPTASVSRRSVTNALEDLGVSFRQARSCLKLLETGATFVGFLAGSPREFEAARRIFHAVGALDVFSTEARVAPILAGLSFSNSRMQSFADAAFMS